MTDKDRYGDISQDREERRGNRDGAAARRDTESGEQRTWSQDDGDSSYGGRGGNTPYGRLHSGSSDRTEGYGQSGGYGDQGGFGSQHGQGGYASPAQGSAYGQTGAEWGRSGYGGFGDQGQQRSGQSFGGGESRGFGFTSDAAERDTDDHRYQYNEYRRGQDRDHGFSGQGGSGAQYATGRTGEQGGFDRTARASRSQAQSSHPHAGEGYDRSGGTYGQGDHARSAQRSDYRSTQKGGQGGSPYESQYMIYEGGDDRVQSGASGGYDRSGAHEHEPSYRRWRDEQLASHDQDYNRWRNEQGRRYDTEYRAYRDQRHQTFTKGFGDWRDKNQSSSQAGTGHPSQDQGRAAAQNAATPATPGGLSESTASASSTGYGTAVNSPMVGESALQNVTNGGNGRADRDDAKAGDADKTTS